MNLDLVLVVFIWNLKREVASAKGRVSTLFDTVYLEGKTSAASYTVDLDAYIHLINQEFGFDIDGSGPSTSAEIGFGAISLQSNWWEMEKKLGKTLAMSVTPEASWRRLTYTKSQRRKYMIVS